MGRREDPSQEIYVLLLSVPEPGASLTPTVAVLYCIAIFRAATETARPYTFVLHLFRCSVCSTRLDSRLGQESAYKAVLAEYGTINVLLELIGTLGSTRSVYRRGDIL